MKPSPVDLCPTQEGAACDRCTGSLVGTPKMVTAGDGQGVRLLCSPCKNIVAAFGSD